MTPTNKSRPKSRAASVSGYGEIVLYKAPDGRLSLDVRLEKDSVWLSLDQIALLFDRDKSVISRHFRNVFASKELSRKSVVAKNAPVQVEGDGKVTREIEYFNLDAIISVGYRVISKRGTQFRIWATGVLRDHILKGYTVNKRRLVQLNSDLAPPHNPLDTILTEAVCLTAVASYSNCLVLGPAAVGAAL